MTLDFADQEVSIGNGNGAGTTLLNAELLQLGGDTTIDAGTGDINITGVTAPATANIPL